MTVTKDDFEKVWASQSPLTPYSFSDAQYKEGWNFVGATPPSRQMWDAFMQNADEKLKYLYQHEDVPLGHEYFTFNPNVPQGSLPLFGGEYDRATYSDLWNWVQEQTGYLKTEAEWQALATANNGNVPYYSDGDGSTTFRVPSLKCWVKGANGTVSEVGSYLAAGLPNITGGFYITPQGDASPCGISAENGAFSYQSNGTIYKWTTNGTVSTHYGVSFDASRSNSIYGNANTVVPESIVGMWLVKAYGVIVDTGSINEQAYIDDRIADLKNVYLPASYQPMSYGTGTVVSNSISSSVSMNAGYGTEICKVSLSKGTWVVTGHIKFNHVTANKVYAIAIMHTSQSTSSADDGSTVVHASNTSILAMQVSKIVVMANDGDYYLNAYAEANTSAVNADIKAVRIA